MLNNNKSRLHMNQDESEASVNLLKFLIHAQKLLKLNIGPQLF